jgi:integrase
MTTPTLGSTVYSFFLDYLPQQKGLRPGSIRSYRDTMRLFLAFASEQTKRGVSELRFEDLDFERVLAFLRELEQKRRNSISTRNQRLAAFVLRVRRATGPRDASHVRSGCRHSHEANGLAGDKVHGT